MKIRNLLVNRIFLVVLIFCTSFIYFSAQAQAADFTLSGTQEVPPNASPGAGICNVTLNDVSGAVSVSCTFSGLIGNPTASHIHGLGSVGVNAGVMLALTVTPGPTTGTITGNGVLNPAQVAGMINGMTYINLHTTAFPGGELRGQVIPEITAASPIPTLENAFLVALTMLLLLAGVLTLRRRLE